MYERDELPLEKVAQNIIRAKLLRPGHRPYKTKNIYASFVKKEVPVATAKKTGKTKRK